jgi:hypothetical protein
VREASCFSSATTLSTSADSSGAEDGPFAAGVTARRETVSATSPRDCVELTFEGLLGDGRLTVAALPDELVAEALPAFLGGDFGVVVGDFAGEGFTPADLADFARAAGAAFAFLERVEGELGCAAA